MRLLFSKLFKRRDSSPVQDVPPLIEENTQPLVQWLETNGIKPTHIAYYQKAFLHKSYAEEQSLEKNNERLEFLGDALLSTVVSHHLFINFPELSEGECTKIKSAQVSRVSLNKLAKELGLTHLIKATGNATNMRNSIPGNTLEALIGAIFIDQGYDAVKAFYETRLLQFLPDPKSLLIDDKNYKSQLLEWGRKKQHQIRWTVDEVATEKDGKLLFQAQVFVNNELTATAHSTGKKKASKAAAKIACEKLDVNGAD